MFACNKRMRKNQFDSALCFLIFIVFFFGCCKFSYGVGRCHNNADDDKNAQHANAHIFEIIYKLNWFKHFDIPPVLDKEAENERACDHRGNLTGNVNADGVHQKEVLIVGIKSHFISYIHSSVKMVSLGHNENFFVASVTFGIIHALVG